MQKLLAVLAALAALVVAAPASASDASLPAHDTAMVTCSANPITGMREIRTAAPTMRGTRPSSETVGYYAQLFRWNGSAWVLHRNGPGWITSTASSGGHVFGGLLFSQGVTFSPVESGYYAVRIAFWWSSTGVVHSDFANEYNGRIATYCAV